MVCFKLAERDNPHASVIDAVDAVCKREHARAVRGDYADLVWIMLYDAADDPLLSIGVKAARGFIEQ